MVLAQRSIWLANALVNVHRSFVRGQEWHMMVKCLRETQCGELRGTTTNGASHFHRVKAWALKRMRCST
eukprot:3263771-Pyramimonas_sp.AAC.1